ncbi:hypothetical protein SAY87_030260 [Trapa incisa]|uniref:non-specific serine/threonine protein kinase n=1 Tax=Trapa incisa TaxID=236973 RepID=A0AAN7QLF3_9MYRT|nr:hypothetical protein SAY87_030260 [Trapa incisa]
MESTHPPTLAEKEALSVTDRSKKAWYLFSLLLSLGRPAHSIELASICTLFHAPPEIIRFLCEIPSSPIYLRSDFFVTPSLTSLVSFFQLMSNSKYFDPPRQLNIEKAYYRKRRRNLDKDGLLPLVKRKVDMSPGEGVGCCPPGRIIDPREKSTSKLRNLQDEEDRVAVHTTCKIEEIDQELSTKIAHQPPDPAPNVSPQIMKDIVLSIDENKVQREGIGKGCSVPSNAMIKNGNSSINDIVLYDCNFVLKSNKDGRAAESMGEQLLIDQVSCLREFEFDVKHECDSKKYEAICENVALPIQSKDNFPGLECSTLQKPLSEQSPDSGDSYGSNISSRKKILNKSLELKRVGSVHQAKEKSSIIRQLTNAHQKLKQADCVLPISERKGNSPALKDQVKVKVLPEFEGYIVEEEEGSGGYGTVYRASRKKDGRTVAIKYPRANAHKYLITNELKMLERFGGKNFIIKCEGSFKSEKGECFVLEHVEHDRPEVLKKDINVLQLQWYGYCLFRALASLHKQGVVHRDVKPGNFLFSRKANKGYLIDFNLAMDLHQKHATKSGKLKLRTGADFNSLPHASNNSLLPGKMKFQGVKSLDAMRKDEIKSLKLHLGRKNLNRKVVNQGKACNGLGTQNTVSRQGAEVSGITSARDPTSTKTPSAERLREPVPQQGRKELINLAQKIHMTRETYSVPAPMRKRVAAPPGHIDGRLINITPMPINSTGISVCGAGLRSKEGDCNKEGPCVGTKGFRAPEVLFRSSHQGPKLDMWSAGVTLLYIITGKMPFLGDPEQNIKDIVKIRGSEDLWEVAKLHNREISFPTELYDTKYLTKMNLQEWCRRNTRRPDFLKVLPKSFFDLLDKCLTVNPRLRISAVEALKNEFFAPCYEELRKQKLKERGSRRVRMCRSLINM